MTVSVDTHNVSEYVRKTLVERLEKAQRAGCVKGDGLPPKRDRIKVHGNATTKNSR